MCQFDNELKSNDNLNISQTVWQHNYNTDITIYQHPVIYDSYGAHRKRTWEINGYWNIQVIQGYFSRDWIANQQESGSGRKRFFRRQLRFLSFEPI